MVAAHLVHLKGDGLLSSSDFHEVKAKDVFLAQEVLPVERHRKLISISQGFQIMRQRLQDLVQAMELPTQRQTAGARALKAKPGPSVNLPGKPAKKEQPGNKPAARADSGSASASAAKQIEPVVQKQAPRAKTSSEAKGSPAPAGVPNAPVPRQIDPPAQAPESGRNGRRQAQVSPAEKPSTGHQPTGAIAPAASPTAEAPSGPAKHNVRADSNPAPIVSQAENQGLGTVQSTMRAKSLATPDTLTTPPSISLVEVARPFVAMVCQELAAAFVNAITQRPAEQELSSVIQAALLQAIPVAKAPHGMVGEREKHQTVRHGRPGADGPHQGTSQGEPEGHHRLDESEEHAGEGDEQPLFDPKLPPSANSSFKPLIGLIGTNVRDLGDLQQFYPQLQLIVVPVDAVQGINDLKSCQRILGMRDEVPAATDEFLRRVFRNRYVRVAGGISRVRDQLTAWLDNPNAMNAEADRPWKQSHAKGQGGRGAKQAPKRRPYPPR